MKTSIGCIILVFGFIQLQAQYYYSDIIGNQLTNQQYRLIKSNQLKKISATSYEGNEVSRDFVLEQTVNSRAPQIITRSASAGNGESFLSSFFNDDRVVKIVDSSSSAINTVTYQYDASGKLVSTSSVNKDFDGSFRSREDHQWVYDEKGIPHNMLKIKNGADTTHVVFKLDENNNVAEEAWKKNNRVTETWYYYYNASGLLTDIVRYSRKAKRMLPDYIFEYDGAGKIIQMTQAQANTANYLIWRYLYNSKGLKEKELVYNKKKEFLGRIEYQYQ